MKNKATLTLSLLASLVLAACGGGGGSNASPTAATSASSPSTASAPAANSPASTPTVTGEQLPSLSSPQAGSTAATGNGVEGIWSVTSSVNKTTAFVDPQNNLSYLSVLGTTVMQEFFGVITPGSSAWTLTSGGLFNLNIYTAATSGSGTFTGNQAFNGSYVEGSNTVNIGWTYDPANALAVTQATVVGTWAETNSSITISSSGAVSGTLSNCPVSGTMLLATAGSNQNLYTLNVTTGTNTSCQTPNVTLSGSAAIVFLPIQSSSLYQRTILYSLHTSSNSAVAYGQVSPQ
ncbi:hypothetical protein P3T42_004730 [Paraburkholderia sp. GAS38]|uniref:hypothetical protein n=1 Tax=Paraburkholderia sp. GAS38 TaxID=3035133 RepID=UPI003D1DE4FD